MDTSNEINDEAGKEAAISGTVQLRRANIMITLDGHEADEQSQEDTFEQDIAHLKPCDVAHLVETVQSGGNATYFIGRHTCPYCQKFAKTLAKAVVQSGAVVYFIDSEHSNKLDVLRNIREQYEIVTIPGFVRVADGQVRVRCDSSMSLDDIIAFMN